MRKRIRAGFLAGLALFVIAGAAWRKGPEPRRVLGDDCYAVCTYQGQSGGRYIGISSDSCDSACGEAEKKCTGNSDGPCTKIRCTATDCAELKH
jgi:hypothetical protein